MIKLTTLSTEMAGRDGSRKIGPTSGTVMVGALVVMGRVQVDGPYGFDIASWGISGPRDEDYAGVLCVACTGAI
jgi:hypothetical protein